VTKATPSETSVSSTTAATDRGEIIVLNRDLFFGVKIGNILRGLGYRVTFVPATELFAERLDASGPEAVLGIIDMGAGVEWSAISHLTGGDGPGTPILAFGSHLDVDGRRAAKAAGVTRILSNGDFHRDMVALVERYARKPDGGAR
jgi:CheY-like chemotaxis protein